MDSGSNENPQGIYDAEFVRRLFNEMAETYGIVNLISSFGFAARWRRQCLEGIDIPAGAAVVDLMTGMGELLPGLSRKVGNTVEIVAVDLSPVMCRNAAVMTAKRGIAARILEADALNLPLPPSSADVVVSSFGLKTFNSEQRQRLAAAIHELLKPGGTYSLVEISVPPSPWLSWPYLFYLRRIIPWIGRLFLGNPDNYRMLSVYTESFGNSEAMARELTRAGLSATPASYFFGCATGIQGTKPPS